jgi:hypothetical protein
MAISSIIKVIISPESERIFLDNEILKPGDELQATILDIRRDGKVLVDFGRFRVFAEIKFPVSHGDVIHVKVVETGKQLMLKLVDRDSEISPKNRRVNSFEMLPDKELKDFLSTVNKVLQMNAGRLPAAVKNILVTISSHFKPLKIGGDISDLISQLKSKIENSGFFFEKKLESLFIQLLENQDGAVLEKTADFSKIRTLINQDLNPKLLLFREFMNNRKLALKFMDERQFENIKNMVEKLLASIENQQNNAIIKKQDPNQILFFTFTLNLKEKGQLAKLKVYPRQNKKSASEEGFRISLLLSMERIGEIRSDISLFPKKVNIIFFVINEKIKTIIENNMESLKKPLGYLFEHIMLNVLVSEAKIADFEKEEINLGINKKVDVRA